MFASTRMHLGRIVGERLRVRSHRFDGNVFVAFGPVDAEVCLSGPPEELTTFFGRLAAEVERYRQPLIDTNEEGAPAPIAAARGVARTYERGPDNAQPTRPQP